MVINVLLSFGNLVRTILTCDDLGDCLVVHPLETSHVLFGNDLSVDRVSLQRLALSSADVTVDLDIKVIVCLLVDNVVVDFLHFVVCSCEYNESKCPGSLFFNFCKIKIINYSTLLSVKLSSIRVTHSIKSIFTIVNRIICHKLYTSPIFNAVITSPTLN